MSYRCATVIPLLFSILILILGLFQIGIYVYFRYLANFLSIRFFSATFCPLWAGCSNFVIGLSLTFVLSAEGDNKWRKMRVKALILFSSITVVQSISWAICEVVEFRLRPIIENFETDEVIRKRLILAYVSSTSAFVLGLIIASCGFFYIFVIFYRLEHVLIDRSITDKVNQNLKKMSAYHRDRDKASKVNTTSDVSSSNKSKKTSWEFDRVRSSTPKASAVLQQQRRRKRIKKPLQFDPVSLVSEVDQSGNLRLDPFAKENGIEPRNLQDPVLKIGKQLDTSSKRGLSYNKIKRAEQKNDKSFASIENSTPKSKSQPKKTIVSQNAWRLPAIPGCRVIKDLYSEESEQTRTINSAKDDQNWNEVVLQ